MRRAALNPYFSKPSVRQSEVVTRERTSKLLEPLKRNGAMGEASPLSVIFKALQSGIVHKYTLGRSGDELSLGNCNVPYCTSVAASFEAIHVAFHFPWLGPLLESLPANLTTTLIPAVSPLKMMKKAGCRTPLYICLT